MRPVRALKTSLGPAERQAAIRNATAIGFYDSIGADSMDEWIVRRVSGDALTRLAGRG